MPVILWGPTGIGKTSAIYEYGQRQDVKAEIIVLHLASQEPGDLVGLPARVEDKNGKMCTVWSRPEWLPDEQDERSFIFFLDEFNRAPKYVLACMFPFLLEGRLHTHRIPKNSWVCAAANPDNDEYDVTEIHDRALISRLCHIEMMPTAEEWLTRHDGVVHEVIHKVVSKEPTHLGFDSFELPFKVHADARAVTLMGQALKNITAIEFKDFGYEFIKGCVGETMAAMVQKEWKDSLENISPEDVLNNYKRIRSDVRKWSSVDNVRNDVIGGANKRLLVHIKKLGKLAQEQIDNMIKYIKDIPRDSAQGLLTQIASSEEFNDQVFKDLMVILGKDQELYVYILEANQPDEAKKEAEKLKKKK